jgi:hypothetical protein
MIMFWSFITDIVELGALGTFVGVIILVAS